MIYLYHTETWPAATRLWSVPISHWPRTSFTPPSKAESVARGMHSVVDGDVERAIPPIKWRRTKLRNLWELSRQRLSLQPPPPLNVNYTKQQEKRRRRNNRNKKRQLWTTIKQFLQKEQINKLHQQQLGIFRPRGKREQEEKKNNKTKTNQLQLQATQNSYWTDFWHKKRNFLKTKQKKNNKNKYLKYIVKKCHSVNGCRLSVFKPTKENKQKQEEKKNNERGEKERSKRKERVLIE